MRELRSEQAMYDLILSVAKEDPRIRGVLLNGSRADVSRNSDDLQDYDITYITEHVTDFNNNLDWLDVFGERLIMQTPSTNDPNRLAIFLMHFKDFTRIDLRLIHPDILPEAIDDAHSIVLLDKDEQFDHLHFHHDQLYLTKRLSETALNHYVNEFYWVSTYVVKGIVREDFFYTQAMYAQPLLESYITLLKQVVLIQEKKQALAFGKANQYLSNYLQNPERPQSYFNMSTLADMKRSLLTMIDDVHNFQLTLSSANNQPVDHTEYQGALTYYHHFLT